MTRRRSYSLIVAAVAVPRLAVLAHERGDVIASFVDKGDDFARTFLASGSYGFLPGTPSAYTQPLYGFFLVPLYWIFNRSWLTVGLAQIGVACVTALLVYELGRRYVSGRAGLVAAVVATLQPYLVWHDVHMNREILDHFLAAATVFLTLQAAERFTPARGAALGVVLGLAILGNVRLEALPLVILAYLFLRGRRSLLAAGAVLAAAALVVMPWVVRNRADVGCWAVTTDARALWKANNLNTYATLKSGQWIDHVPQPKSFPPTPQDVYEHWLATGRVTPYDECAQVDMFERKVISFWVNHPGAKAQLMPLDAQWLWQPQVVGVSDRPGQGTWLDTMRFYAEPAFMIALYALAVIGLFLVPVWFSALAVAMLAYQTLAAMLFVGETRYRVPWDFLIALLASSALLRMPRTRNEMRSAVRRLASSRS